jgi:hypothetical protein
VLCKDQHGRALACLTSPITDLSLPAKLPSGVRSPYIVREDDWTLPKQQYLAQLELLQRLTSHTQTQPLLLTDSEFCILSRKIPSIFQIAVKNFRDPKPIINANVRYDDISVASLALIEDMNSFFTMTYKKCYNDTSLETKPLSELSVELQMHGVGCSAWQQDVIS